MLISFLLLVRVYFFGWWWWVYWVRWMGEALSVYHGAVVVTVVVTFGIRRGRWKRGREGKMRAVETWRTGFVWGSL